MTDSIDRLRRATGPRYQDRSVGELDDDFIVDEIDRLRRRGIDTWVTKNPDNEVVDELIASGDRGDAVVRLIQGEDPDYWAPYRVLWNEFIRRTIDNPI